MEELTFTPHMNVGRRLRRAKEASQVLSRLLHQKPYPVAQNRAPGYKPMEVSVPHKAALWRINSGSSRSPRDQI